MSIVFSEAEIERFWAAVHKRGPDECWPFRGVEYTAGSIVFNKKRYGAHRLAFYLTHGHWPDPVCRHSCDHGGCCNPAHLQAGTHMQNTADMMIRGRHASGRVWPAARFPEEEIDLTRV